jgi:peptide/nickel transport system ATP-binding protein/oligopeptide transport system ATP-binding protein
MTTIDVETSGVDTAPPDSLLVVDGLAKRFVGRRTSGLFRKPPVATAVDDITFEIGRAESLGLVGESGCGKTTVARMILDLIKPDEGRVQLDGVAYTDISRRRFRRLIRPKVQAVFQNPAASLNPRKTVYQTLRGVVLLHKICRRRDAKQYVIDLLEQVGLSPGAAYLGRRPHQLSGGQQQRVGIAKALAVHPKLIVADEPVSALDVSVRGQIINLLRDAQVSRGISMLLISHDLAVVRTVAHRVAVMYLGRIVEIGQVEDILHGPKHPYTKALLAANPRVDGTHVLEVRLSGEPPSARRIPSGCRFHPRCPIAEDRCAVEEPQLVLHGSRRVACHFADST